MISAIKLSDLCGQSVRRRAAYSIMCHYPILLYKSSYNPDCYMLCGHVHTTRENDFLNKWREELKSSRTMNSHNCGNIINVGCMMPYMGYTPRTLQELIKANS